MPPSPPSPAAFSLSKSDLTTLTNKTVLITGGSSGIGLATAHLIHSLHPTNNVVSLDLQPPVPNSPGINTTSLLASPRFLHIPTDVTSWRSQRHAFTLALQTFHRIDAVFVNAGIAEHAEQFFNSTLDAEGLLSEPDRRTLTIDLDAATMTVRLAIWVLRKNNPANHDANTRVLGTGGSIIMTASLAGYLASAGAANYSAAKHGIVGLMRALKQDTLKHGIGISVVAPGMTVTPIISQERQAVFANAGQDTGAGAGQEKINAFVREMKAAGVAWNEPATIAVCVAYLVVEGVRANGMGLMVQGDRVTDVEAGLARSRGVWMGEEQLRLFRGGRGAGLFPNKL